MSVVQEFRNQPPPPRRSGGLILMGVALVIVVAAGALIGRYAHAVSWGSFAFWSSAGPIAAGPKFEGERLGSARNAPLLRTCVAQFARRQSHRNGPDIDLMPDISMIYAALKAGTIISRFTTSKQEDAKYLLAAGWAVLADCIFDERIGGLCRIDDRALAIEATNSLILLTREKLPLPRDTLARELGRAADPQTVRARALRTLRNRIEAGEFIARDFGSSAQPEIRELFDGTKPERNVCEKA